MVLTPGGGSATMKVHIHVAGRCLPSSRRAVQTRQPPGLFFLYTTPRHCSILALVSLYGDPSRPARRQHRGRWEPRSQLYPQTCPNPPDDTAARRVSLPKYAKERWLPGNGTAGRQEGQERRYFRVVPEKGLVEESSTIGRGVERYALIFACKCRPYRNLHSL